MAQEPWQVAGSASEVYEQYLVPAYFAEWAQILTRSIPLTEGARVLDVACGTGVVARAAGVEVGADGKIVGLDLNPGMLSVARDKSKDVPAESEWIEASVTEMPLPDDEFDNVYCQAGIMFFPDRPAALSEMYRVVTPGGLLAASVWRALHRTPGFDALARALERHVSDESAEIVRSPFCFDVPADLRKLANDAGFKTASVTLETRMVRFPSVEAFFAHYTGGSPLAPHVAGLRDAKPLISQMKADLSSYVDDSGLAFPIEGLILAATK